MDSSGEHDAIDVSENLCSQIRTTLYLRLGEDHVAMIDDSFVLELAIRRLTTALECAEQQQFLEMLHVHE